MAEPLEFDPSVAASEPLLQPPPDEGRFMANPEEEIKAKARLGWFGQELQRGWTNDAPPDPSYHVWRDMAGYEEYAGTLAESRSKAETDALKRMIDRNRKDQQTAASGELGLMGDLMAGIMDPVNVIPVPAVKGIGLVRGALRMGGALGAISVGTEIVRINADPTGEWNEMPGNIGVATLLGGLIGAPVGMLGARAARAERAMRAFERDIGNIDSPFNSLRPRSADEGLRFESGRPPRNADGSWPLFAQVDRVTGYEPRTVEGVRYVFDDGIGWTTAAEEGRAGPLAVGDDLAEHLGTPVPIHERVQMGDEVRVKAEHNKGQWHDELQGYVEGDANIRHLVKDANDYYNFRHFQHLAEEALPLTPGENPQAWKLKTGKLAMQEYRGSQQTGDYATAVGRILGRLNFSPVVKAIRVFAGDNRVADLSLRIGGDYKWAIEGNRTGWSTPPSLILNAMRQHSPRYHQFQNEFMAEWVKYASGDQNYGGRTFQGLNVSAAGYALRRGLRRSGGAQGMTLSDFEEMVTEAVFNPNAFEVRGFPVNDNARAAAKAFTRMAQEYDGLLRASGVFRDQKNLTHDIKHWSKQIVYFQNRLMEWQWGPTGKPENLDYAIRVRVPTLLEGGTERHFTGDSHDDAIMKMIDELGDEGITLSEQIDPVRDHGYTYRAREPIPPAGPAPVAPAAPPAMEGGGGAAPETFINLRDFNQLEGAASEEAHGSAAVFWNGEVFQEGNEHTDVIANLLRDHPEAQAAIEADPESHLGFIYRKEAAPAGGVEARLETEDLAEQVRLRGLVEGGQATPDDEAALKAIDRRILKRQAEEMGLFKGMAVPTKETVTFSFEGTDYTVDADIVDWIKRSINDPIMANAIRQGLEAGNYNTPEMAKRIAAEIAAEPRKPPEIYDAETVVPQLAHDPAIEKFWTVGQALDYVRAQNLYPEVIDRIRKDAGDIPLEIISRQLVEQDPTQIFMSHSLGGYDPDTHSVRLRGEGFNAAGTNPETVVHEAVHGASSRRLLAAEEDKLRGVTNEYTQALDKLTEIRDVMNLTPVKAFRDSLDEVDLYLFDKAFSESNRDIHEMLTYGLTSPHMRAFLKSIPAQNPTRTIKTRLDEFIRAVAELLGIKTEAGYSQLEKLLSVQDDLNKLVQPTTAGERAPGIKAMAAPGEGTFISVEDAMQQRVARMSPAQRAIFDERAGGLRLAEENLAKAQADLKVVTEMPHQFLDANGRPEPWYHRVWDKSKGATQREQLTRLVTRWFERDNPDGARQRAELAVDNILGEDAEIAGTGTAGTSALRQRTLNMPNSWSIEDPEFGTIKVSDFIDKRILAVSEHYSKRAGVLIEAHKMFGPGGIKNETAQQREYLLKTYWEPASDTAKPGILEMINEVEAHQDIAYRSVAGTLRTSDPMRVDNRFSRFVKDFSTLGVMGKVAFASVPELLRPGMVNGFGVQFNVILQKYLGDLEKLRGNTELLETTGELFDLAGKMHHVQAVTIQDGEPVLGGTWFEQMIHEQVPNLYKISGLTSLTTWQKTIAGLTAQHSVMEQAIHIGEAIRGGTIPDQAMMARLNAMGISARDALLLSRMPVEHYQGGRLILPAVDNWKGLGADGRRAREVLTNGVHAEMRRSIVTPSVGDRSSIFNGVWTRQGKVVVESDIMTIPMQFLSYGMGAHNAMLISSLQGRDRTLVMGMFYALLMGMFADWFRTPSGIWQNKKFEEKVADGFDASGIGGFWFSNLNTQIERASSGALGVRPLLGIKTDFDKKTATQGVMSGMGVAPGYFYDLSRAFWDSSISATERAQLIRKGVPYNNVVWWAWVFNDMAKGVGGAFEGNKP